jgi:hypothetical protein
MDQLSNLLHTNIVTRNVSQFFKYATSCKKAYKKLIDLAGKNARMIEEFAKFLDVAEWSKNAESYRELAANYRLKQSKELKTEHYFNYFDDQTIVFIVNLEKSDRGKIVWVSESKHGFRFNLKNAMLHHLIHRPVAEKH